MWPNLYLFNLDSYSVIELDPAIVLFRRGVLLCVRAHLYLLYRATVNQLVYIHLIYL